MFKPPPNIDNLTRIISRKEWGARAPTKEIMMKVPVPYVLFTFTETPACKSREECIEVCQKMQEEHMAQGMSDIRFNFMIGDDLNVYEGRGWHIQPSVTEKHYQDKVGRILEIAYLGELEQNFPPQPVFDVRDALIEYGFLFKYIDKSYFLQPG